MAAPLIGNYSRKRKSHGRSLNYWVEGLIHITIQALYDIKYITMSLSGYINYPIEPEFLALRYGMEYIMHPPHEPILYSRKNIFKIKKRPLQYFFNSGNTEINKKKNITTSFTNNMAQIMQ